jgi:ribosomal protein S18 acetylase RimI-like enzyme
METSIRTFRREDIEFALAQTRREGWDPTAELFETCLAHDPDGCFIAETGGQPIGLVTTTRYVRGAWIGNLIVLPGHRRQGIGQRLMTRAMEHLSDRGVRTIRLEADPPGIQIYRRLGFVDESESLRFRFTPDGGAGPAAAERVTPADLPALAAFDAEHFGDERKRLLELLYQQATATYWVRGDGAVRGYAFTVPSTLGVRLGPCVATDRPAAELLLQSVMADSPNTTIVLGVSEFNDGAIGLFESLGFERAPSSFRMVYGLQDGVGRHANVYAIANGAMG